MNQLIRKLLIGIFSFFSIISGWSQVQVVQKIDHMQILIGQQAHLQLTVSLKKGQKGLYAGVQEIADDHAGSGSPFLERWGYD
jgi:hypothetical protein